MVIITCFNYIGTGVVTLGKAWIRLGFQTCSVLGEPGGVVLVLPVSQLTPSESWLSDPLFHWLSNWAVRWLASNSIKIIAGS